MELDKSTTLRLDAEMYRQLEQSAREDMRKMSDQARYLISLGMEVRERWEEYRMSAIKAVVNKESGSPPPSDNSIQRDNPKRV